MDAFAELLRSEDSSRRTRGLTLLAYNARWDRDCKLDECIDEILRHIRDIKPITARKCIQLLPMIAQYKLELRRDIVSALENADFSTYKDTMRPLLYKDTQQAQAEIAAL